MRTEALPFEVPRENGERTYAALGRDVEALAGLREAFEAYGRAAGRTTAALTVLSDRTTTLGVAPSAPPSVVDRRRAANRVARSSRRANRR